MSPLEAMWAVFAAWERGDPEALAPLFRADGVYLDPLKPVPLEGRDAIVEGNRPAMAALVDCRITVDLELQDADRAVVEGLFASRLGDSGARFDFRFMAVVELRDGQIARLAEYFDTRPLINSD